MRYDAHRVALERAYALIESAQGEMTPAEIEAAVTELSRCGLPDVRVLAAFARSLAVVGAGGDDSAHIREMIAVAAEQGDPGLLALSLAASAGRRAAAKKPQELTESSARPLVRAVALLDAPGGAVVHRATALIEVGCVSHALGLWELAVEHYDLAEQALAAQEAAGWARGARRLRVVLTINRTELVADWACAHAMIGEWDVAAARAATVLARADEVTDDWPPSWLEQYRNHWRVLQALATAGEPGSARHRAAVLAAVSRGAGDPGELASLVPGVAAAVPPHARLLALRLAAERDGGARIALRYADELATLRWNDRLHRVANIREAIAVERRQREHEQLRRDLLTDDLTGLANRRGYHAYVDDRRRAGGAYAVLMVDVDHFKAVNDGFGHDVGDLVLARIAGILQDHVRPGDLAARLGGDEFVVILAGVPDGVPARRAQKIIDAVRAYPWDALAAGLAVSVSIGVHAGGGAELAALLSGADRNLYRAKEAGRGRVVTPAP